MARFLFRSSAALLVLSAAMLAIGEIPAQASNVHLFSSCRDIESIFPYAPDGDYVLYNNGNLFTVYCYNMATAPSEYIDLAETGQDVNFSQYTAGGASPGTNVRTTFTKLRVDPATLTVDIGDLTFASSTGSLRHSGYVTVTSMSYGVAMSCIAPTVTGGVGNINLQDTPFQLDNPFKVGGFEAAGSARVSSRHQLANLRGGGYCGWIAPALAPTNPFNPSPGMYQLKLSCAQHSPVIPARRQLCIHIGHVARVTEQVQRQHGHTTVALQYDGRPVATLGADDQILP